MVGRHAGFAARDANTLHLEQFFCISDSKTCMSATQFPARAVGPVWATINQQLPMRLFPSIGVCGGSPHNTSPTLSGLYEGSRFLVCASTKSLYGLYQRYLGCLKGELGGCWKTTAHTSRKEHARNHSLKPSARTGYRAL